MSSYSSWGRLQFFQDKWTELTSDPVILNMVSGLDIPLVDVAFQQNPPNLLTFSPEEMAAADKHIDELLAKGAIREYDSVQPGDFVSTVFLRPKKDGGYHMILNLKDFNQFVEYNHFKMETLKDICNSISPNCYMAVIDLQDAYLVIPINPNCWKYLSLSGGGKCMAI